MRNRRPAGTVLAFAAVLSIIVCLIGVGVYYILKAFGGSMELQGATDSGNLGITRKALTGPTIALKSGLESDNFSGLTESNGKLDLLSYNRVMGQTLLVALNASVEDTQDARDHAGKLIKALHSDSECISKRMSDSLQNWTSSDSSFIKLAEANSTRLLDNARIEQKIDENSIAYVDKGSPTNIYLDPSILPSGASLPSATLSKVKSSESGQFYINGYTDLKVTGPSAKPGQIPPISGATINPKQQPHRISVSTFLSSNKIPVTAGIVPPNAFQSATLVRLKDQQEQRKDRLKQISSSACAVVGALNTDYPACIPHGYIVIYNPPGNADKSPLPSKESIFNNQLFTGIFIANNGAFSTDQSLIQAWADYNNNGKDGKAPPIVGLFNVKGEKATTEQDGITSLGGNGYPAMADYTNVQGPNASRAAEAMLPAFKAAYPSTLADNSSETILTAVEKLKAEVMALYTTGSGGMPAPAAPTGLRVFEHDKIYVAKAGQSAKFTHPGTVIELCNQANADKDGSEILKQLKQRMKEIKPSATEEEMTALLSGNTIDLGQTFYIWLENDTFRMTASTPPWVTATQTPDGKPQTDSIDFATIGLTVDPVGECGFNQTLFADEPDPATSDRGIDSATWTPSTGYNNLLGKLTFGESIGNVITDKPPACVESPWVKGLRDFYAQGAAQGKTWEYYATTLPPKEVMQHIVALTRVGGRRSRSDLWIITWDRGTKTCNPLYYVIPN